MKKEHKETESKTTFGKFKQFFATICLGPISIGSSIVWTSPVLPQLLKNETANSTMAGEFFGEGYVLHSSFQLTLEEGSWVGSMLAFGSLGAAIPAGFLADRFGPKRCILGFVIPVIIFTLFGIFARDVYTMCVGRVFSGIATGGVSVVAPMYISEIADVSLRGTLGSFFELLIYLGIVFTAICGAYVHYVILTAIIGVLALTLGILFLFFPESPTYLVKINRRDKAEAAIKFYRSQDFDVSNALNEISNGLSKQPQNKTTIVEYIKTKAFIRGLTASVGLTCFQQMSGIDGITFYTVLIFQEAGASVGAYTSSIIVSFVELLGAGMMVFIVERLDRKVFLYISSVGTCVCLVVFGCYFTLKEMEITQIGALPLTSMIFYNIFFAAGLGPVPWMINGELFAPEIKGFANGVTITLNWIFLFIITKTMPMMLIDWGAHYTFYTYGAFMVLCVLFINVCVPETRGKTLEQIQEELKA